MALLGYNRKLMWVVLPAMLWAWLGVAAALGPPHGPGQPPPGGEPPVRFGIGPAAGGVYLSGVVKRVVEEPGQLVITIEAEAAEPRTVPAPGEQPEADMPPGLRVDYVTPGELPPGPPELRLLGGMREGRRLPSGASGILTERFLLKIDEHGVRVLPRPRELGPPPRGGPGGPGARRERPRDRIRERAQQWFEKRPRREKERGQERKKENERDQHPRQPAPVNPVPGEGGAQPGAPPDGAGRGQTPPPGG
jgi:hypothetical protein